MRRFTKAQVIALLVKPGGVRVVNAYEGGNFPFRPLTSNAS
jgi:hypothetical protein